MNDAIPFDINPKVADLHKPPPRKSTPALEQAIRLMGDASPAYSRIWITILAQYVGMGFFAAVFFFVPGSTIFISAGFLGFALLFHIIVLFFKHRYFGKIRFLFINGSVKKITVLDNEIIWSTQVNDTPQRRIYYELDGSERLYKTYNHNLADEFVDTLPVLIHPRCKLIVPLSFLIKYEIKKPFRTRRGTR